MYLIIVLGARETWGYWRLLSSPPGLEIKGLFKKSQFPIEGIYEIRTAPTSLWGKVTLVAPLKFQITMNNGLAFSKPVTTPGIEELVDTLVSFCRTSATSSRKMIFIFDLKADNLKSIPAPRVIERAYALRETPMNDHDRSTYYKAINVWERMGEGRVACYRCVEILGTHRFVVQSADFYNIPLQEVAFHYLKASFSSCCRRNLQKTDLKRSQALKRLLKIISASTYMNPTHKTLYPFGQAA